MNNIAIRVENLSKLYRIGQREAAYKTLRESIMNLFARRDGKSDTIWALKDVSFEVKRGEVIGIIGRNGSGKTTLLKILSRITEPTEGHAEVHGRVGSLLEVGTGFHPELTGRENIFLNGAILGMKKTEISRKFDEIVAFAEIEKFMDTPVKRYSSGMYVRLAFAVAAHLEPEILLVDEVLAVGDAGFQKKCLGKMGDVAREGRTVLFVSHNMSAISRLCERVFLLNGGELEKDGISTEVISEYLQASIRSTQHFSQPADHSIPLCLIEAEVSSKSNSTTDIFPRHNPITVRVVYKVNRGISSVHIYSTIMTLNEIVVLGTGDADTDPGRFNLRKPGVYECQYEIPPRVLNEGDYTINVSMGIPYQKNFQENVGILRFSIVDIERVERFVHHQRAGVVWLDLPWDYPNGEPFS
ncbi:ABC transporter ATP-binding protein [Candidatus Poribacteria bacterium]